MSESSNVFLNSVWAVALRTHLKIHTGVKSHKCNQCDYASYQSGQLSRHLKIHSGEKSNKCNQCDYACSDPSSFRVHLRKHTDQKTHKCNICDYASDRTSKLRSHLKIHSGEKSFKCNQCDFASKHAQNLRRHMKKHITQNWFCLICFSRFLKVRRNFIVLMIKMMTTKNVQRFFASKQFHPYGVGKNMKNTVMLFLSSLL